MFKSCLRTIRVKAFFIGRSCCLLIKVTVHCGVLVASKHGCSSEKLFEIKQKASMKSFSDLMCDNDCYTEFIQWLQFSLSIFSALTHALGCFFLTSNIYILPTSLSRIGSIEINYSYIDL